jgi:glycogen synthase
VRISMLMSVFGQHAMGGAERSAEKSALALAGAGHDVSLVSLSAAGQLGGACILPSGLRHCTVPLSQVYDPYGLDGGKAVPTDQRPGLYKAMWHLADIYNPVMASRLLNLWRVERPDVVITHTLQGFSVAAWHAARSSGAALVHMIHDHALICPGTAMTRGMQVCQSTCLSCSAFSRARRAVSCSPLAVVAPSRAVLARHRQAGWFHDVVDQRVIENCLAPGWPIAALRRAPPLNTRWCFGYLGRLDASKGVDTLLEAARLLSDLDFRFHLAGPGDTGMARALIEQYGLTSRVTLEGPVDAASFLAGIDVLVTPSRALETFCNVVMEAASLGIPSIVSDRGALPERVAYGAGGWIVPAGDANALARIMRLCREDPAQVEARGEAAYKTRVNYEPARQSAAWSSVCEDALAMHCGL